jgi:cytochrome c biogenesis protein CcdA
VPEGALFGGSVVAALVAGGIALFAPCCIGVMLPAYLAAAFQNQRRRLALTFLFGAGVATVIVPIALGAAVLVRLINVGHQPLYLAGGALMAGLGLYTLAGGHIRLPSPGHRAGAGAGPAAVYTLGVFSGIATSCCTPVLAGVVALSGLSASLPAALGLALAYVTGMVAPLFVMSLLWDGIGWRPSPRRRRFTWRLGPVRRTIGASDLASGLLLLVMSAISIWVALTGVPASDGWQAQVAVTLQGAGQAVTRELAILPNWLAGILLALALLALGWWALAQVGLARPRGSTTLKSKED